MPSVLPPEQAGPATKESVLFALYVSSIMGGAEMSMFTLAEGLRRKGYAVTLAIFGRTENIGAQHVGPDVEIVRMDAQRTLTAIFPLYHLVRKLRPAILITALTPTNVIGILAALAAHTHTRVIATEHGPLSLDPRHLSGWQKYLLPTLAGLLYTGTDEIVAVSQGLADFVQNVIFIKRRRPVRVIYNPVIREPRSPLPIFSHPWIQENKDPIVIGVGRLEPEKNFTLLLQAFAQVAHKRPSRLIILGEGSEKAKLLALAQELGVSGRVLFPGFVANVDDWLHCASVFVCASDFEGFGNAIVEAMDQGLTVVSADCPYGPAEILDGGHYGHLVPCGDARAMAAAIEQALDKPMDPSIVRARAALFSQARCFDAYDTLIGELRRAS